MDAIDQDTGIGIYQIESLRELDAIAAISCWGWDPRVLDVARSQDPAKLAMLDCQSDFAGDRVAFLPRLSDPRSHEDIHYLWQIQNRATIALLPVGGGEAWAAVSVDWLESPPAIGDARPFQITPHKWGTHVGRTQAIAICLGAIANTGKMFDLNHLPTRQTLLPSRFC